MYYKLKTNYILRGWNNLPCCLHNVDTGKTSLIDKMLYKTLLKCDGTCDDNSIFMSDDDRKNIETLFKDGYLDRFDDVQVSISDYQKYYKYDNYFLDAIKWSITGNCNYKCLHCFMNAPNFEFDEYSKEDAFKFIDDMEKCGVFNVDLTGGEAMVHRDFWAIVDRLIEKNIHISSIYSNGFLVNESFFENLKKRSIKPSIYLSFDGINNWHEWLRNVKGAGKHIENALKLCQENGINTSIGMCIHKNNACDLFDNIKYLASFGCSNIKINSIEDFGCAKTIADIQLSDDELFELCLDFIPKYYKEKINVSIMFSTICVLKPNGVSLSFVCDNKKLDFSKLPICPFARGKMYADANGYCLPCVPYSFDDKVEESFPSIIKTDLSSILSHSKYLECISYSRNDYYEHNSDCLTCKYYEICSTGCRGRAASLNNGNLYAKDVQCCNFFKNGQYERIKKVIDDCYGK